MPDLAHVTVHSSAFPENVRRELLQSLRERRINPKLHYVSYKQSEKWLALHEAHSPARTDADCAAIYDQSFCAAAESIGPQKICLIGLGCGGGQKDARLLEILKGQGRVTSYVPSDVSLALVLTSSNAAEAAVPGIYCVPLVCDLSTADNLPQVLETLAGEDARLLTFFGMIPNFEPDQILPRLASLVRSKDYLLFSANLAPGLDYAAGVEKVLPGYDNELTLDWLLTFLYDLGVDPGDGSAQFAVETSKLGFKRIVADYVFSKPRNIAVHGEKFEFRPGEKMRLFFSYRYTPEKIKTLLSNCPLSIIGEWIAKSDEEGVFLCRRAGG